MVKIFTVFLIVILSQAMSVQAEDHVRVVVHLGSGWADEEGTGFAQEMFRRISRLADMPNELEVYPLRRALNAFTNEGADCYFAATEETFENALLPGQVDVIPSVPFTQDSVYAFSLKGESKISDYTQLLHQQVLMSIGLKEIIYTNPSLNEGDFDYTIVESEEQAVKMLLKQRSNIYIRFRSTLSEELKAIMHYDENYPLFSTYDSINCHDTQRLRAYIKKMNIAITTGIQEGVFDDLYDRFNREKPAIIMSE